jgi:hypothetical protein
MYVVLTPPNPLQVISGEVPRKLNVALVTQANIRRSFVSNTVPSVIFAE